jgi:hypothetical protein
MPKLPTNLVQKCLPIGCAFLLAALAACNTISSYDQAAYSQVISAKVDALALMDKAGEPYDSQQKEIESTTLELDKAFEYEKGRALNQITIQQWTLLLDPGHDLFGGFLKSWQTKGRLNAFFITAKKKQVASAFDQIIQLEAQKNR